RTVFYLYFISFFILSANVFAQNSIIRQKNFIKDETIGLPNDKVDGEFIGGLKNQTVPVYSKELEKKDYVVHTKSELLAALETAQNGEVVYIDDKASIDLSNHKSIVVPGGVTIASGRGINNSK